MFSASSVLFNDTEMGILEVTVLLIVLMIFNRHRRIPIKIGMRYTDLRSAAKV